METANERQGARSTEILIPVTLKKELQLLRVIDSTQNSLCRTTLIPNPLLRWISSIKEQERALSALLLNIASYEAINYWV